MSFSIYLLMPAIFLIIGMIDDILFKKFHNKLFLVLFSVAFITTYISAGPDALVAASLSIGMCCLLFIPLVLIGALGAGDFKLSLCVAWFLTWQQMGVYLLAAMFWGAILGLLKVILSGKINLFILNMKSLSDPETKKNLTHIPFTVALFLAWASVLMGGV